MATKVMQQPWLWKRFVSNAIDTYVGFPGEPIIDLRTGTPILRICDGITPKGHLVGTEGVLSGVATPVIVSPLDGATGVSGSPIITASPFYGLVSGGGEITQAAAFWEVSTVSNFATTVYQSGRDTVNKTSIDLNGKVALSNGVKYARVRYEGDTGTLSNWSAPVGFTVQNIGPGAVIDGDIVVGQIGGDWLLVAPATKRATNLRWGLYGTDTTLPNIGSAATPDPNTGKYNTDILTSATYNNVNDGYVTGAQAAKFCRDQGYDLPNKEELNLIYQNRAAIDAADTSGGGNTLAAFAASGQYAWSSTEGSSSNAWIQRFSDGSQYFSHKNFQYWVLPARRISA